MLKNVGEGDKGCDVKINVAWDTNGPEVLNELANLVVISDASKKADKPETSKEPGQRSTSDPFNESTGDKPLSSGPWRYTGSEIGPGGFAAAAEGSIISLIEDPAALMVNPRDSAQHDDVHTANPSLIPPKGSPVRIILTLPALQSKP